MQPKDMAQKKFKLIPGADYTPLKDDTFGEAFGALISKRNKQIAGQMPGSFDKNGKLVMNVDNEGVEKITDFINPMRGMYVPVSRGIKDVVHKLATGKVEPKEVSFDQMKGIFSDVNSKIPMRWVDDSKMHLFSPDEIAGKLRSKYYPEHLEQSKYDHPTDWEEAVSNELSMLNRKKVDLEANGPIEELIDVNQRIAWAEDPNFEMDWAKQTDGRNLYRLDQIMHHPELFKEQPHLRDIKVDYKLDGDTMGSYSSKFREIGLNRTYGDNTTRKVFGRNAEKSTVLHEIQHAIQDESGWPRGGNVDEFKAAYSRNRKRMTKIIANLESKEMLGDPFDKELLARTRAAYDNLETPFDKYQSLHGEQQARAVQAMFKNPERFKYGPAGKRVIPQTPYSTL